MADNRQIAPVTADDCVYERHLARKFTDELGFLPALALEWYADRGLVWRIRENGDPAGFLVARLDYAADNRLAGIIQAAIDFDLQRRRHGLALVEHAARLATSAGKTVLQCWCAADLPANDFWRAAGFTAAGTRPGGRSRNRKLILWRRPLAPAADILAPAIHDPRRGPGGRYATPADDTPKLFPEPETRRLF